MNDRDREALYLAAVNNQAEYRRRIEILESRLAAVLALCDDPPVPSRMLVPMVRAAATGGE